ncbi:MAG: cation:proton antiporter, partial [Oscillospiraceae bacterium]|nr:cation:proton antiporter [Oscillospiraceae bacterium]
MLAGQLCRKIRLPSLIGMLAAGILLGPFVFGLIDDSILNVSADIRK